MDQNKLDSLQSQLKLHFDLEAVKELIVYYEQQKNYHELEELYLKLLEFDAHNLMALNNLAVIYADHLGNQEEAKVYYEKILDFDPNEPFVHFNYGTLLEFQFNDYEKALKHYKEAIRINGFYVEAYLHASWLYLIQLHDIENAYAVIESGIEKNHNWELHAHLAYIDFMYRKNYNQAIKECQLALEISPKNSLVLTYMGQIYVLLDNPDKAYIYFKQAHETHQLNHILVFEYGKLLITYYKDFDQAMALLKEAVEFFPESAIYPSYLANLYLSMGHLEEATIYLRKAEEMSNKGQDALLLLGYLKAIIDHDSEDAMLYFEKAVEINPNNLSALSVVGFYNLLSGQHFDLALEYFNRIIELKGEFYPAYFLAAQIYSEYYQNYQKALETYLKIDPKKLTQTELIHLYTIVGQLLEKELGDTQGALEYYEKAYEIKPDKKLEDFINTIYESDKTLIN